MSLLGSVDNLSSAIKNPFSKELGQPKAPDFLDGFVIEELEGPKKTVRLFGNTLPFQPFAFGGQQRIVKQYYSGHSEPSVQVLGPKENDTIIRGRLKDKRYTGIEVPEGTAISTEIQQLIDSIRIRGNLCRFRLGEWERYGFIEETNFDLKRLADVDYEIKLSIIGFNVPTNAKFLERKKEVPFAINADLIQQAEGFNAYYSNIPLSVPRSASDLINGVIGDVAGAIATLTNFVDTILTSVQDIQKSIARAKGLIKYCQTKLDSYKKAVGALDPFSTDQALTGRYERARYYSGSIASAAVLSELLNRYRTQFNNLQNSLPLARHTVKEKETLQKISIKYYGNADNWKSIYDYNNLTSTDLEVGLLLEIPRE